MNLAYDYYPFGMLVPNRHGSSNSYRYGFQGQEKDDELKGEGNSLNYTFRMHDPRVGRFFAVDPLANVYPFYTPYQFSGNMVIHMRELEGLEPAATQVEINTALKLIDAFEKEKETKQYFKSISKQSLVDDLRKVVKDPAQISIPPSSGYYCALYALGFSYARSNPEGYVNTVISLYREGKAKIGDNEIDATTSNELSKKNLNLPNYHEPSAFIFGASVRETENGVMDVDPDLDLSMSTDSDNMRDMLKNLNYSTKKFSYEYEYFSDGILEQDLGTLEKHINSGGMAFAMVYAAQFNNRNDKNSGWGGNHWIVLNSNFKYNSKKNTVNFTVYDDHFGNQNIEMKADIFMDMIYDVIMTK
ncbi:MAG: RHS repeat domain-containing protein [Bacteroidia bacterium]